MDSPTQFPNVKQTLSMIQEVVLYIWNILMGFVGATEESSRQWKLIFERRILKGSIGFPQRWFGHSQNNVLWEVETLVKNLSREDQTSLKELEKIVKGARNTTGAFQASNGRDCNVNNYWVPRQGSRNKTWPRETQDVKKRKTHEPKAGTVPAQYPDFSAGEDVAINDDDVSCCASDLINSVYWESVMQTSSDDMTFHSLPQEIDSPFLHTDYDELLHEAQQTDGDQTDCGINCKRSLSTSVLVDDQYDSKIGNGQSHDTDTVRSMSLPTLCPEKDAELDMLNQTFEKSYGMPDWWLETAEIATCPGTDTDTSTIENMYLDIGRQPILRHVTEPILNDIPHTESEQEIGFDPCTVKGTYVRKFQLALDTNDIINNNDVMTEDEQTGDHGKVNPSCICHPRRDGQRQDCHINSVSDTPPLGSAESVTHRMQHHTNSSARSLGYHQASGSVGKWARGGLDEREFNCNAIHEDNRTSGSAVDLVYSVCSKMSSPVDIGLHTTCPIESCAISDCLLNDKTMPKAESETSLTSHPLRNFIRNMKDKFRRLVIFDDTPLDQIAPMKKDSKVGVNVQQIRHTDPQQAKGHPNMDEFMAPLKFDVSIKPQVEPSHPLDILQTRFGVGPVKLTRRPESVRIPDPIHPRGDHSAPNLLISLLKTPTDLIRDAVQRIRPKYYVEKDSIDSKEGPTNVTQQTIPALPAKPPLVSVYKDWTNR